ncbi:MAG: hypothetical protein LKF88_03290 [Microbacteriaceae bacterium]|jgi:hypothetical protein|nr:hypothetical protein [Microbacteriaceae bacterium]
MADTSNDTTAGKQTLLGNGVRALLAIGGIAPLAVESVAMFLRCSNAASVPILLLLGSGVLYAGCSGKRISHITSNGIGLAQAMKLRRTLLKNAVASVQVQSGTTSKSPINQGE